MSLMFIFLLMIFMHIVDDYYLQGWLASAKQRTWWAQNAPQKIYKYDYIWALLMHSYSWAFMIMLPIAYIKGFNVDGLFTGMFIINMIIHALTDNLKANVKVINLWIDQLIHIFQIIITFLVLSGL